MIKFLLTIAIAVMGFFAIPAFAGMSTDSVTAAGFSSLTETQKADIISQVAKANESNATTSVSIAAAVSNPQKVSEWVDVGTKIGQGLGGAAKELGVAVNDFVKTPVGMAVMSVFIWKFMGAVIMHAVGAFMVIVVGFTTLYYFVARRGGGVTVTYDPERKDVFGRALLVSKVRPPITGDDAWGAILCGAVVLIAALITMFTY